MNAVCQQLVATLVLLPVVLSSAPVTANNLNRDAEPIVLTGSEVNMLFGVDPSLIVGFKWDGGWVQIPIQIDERAVKDYGEVYNSAPFGYANLAYTDAGTFMGPDPDPLFDADDELVFMAKDAGDVWKFGVSNPVGVLPAPRWSLEITDPITQAKGWVDLFLSDGSLTPDAGADYVTYTFNLLAGPYLTHYNTTTGPNPEDSEITTAFYRMHFKDRWSRDEINLYAGGATGVDIFDRHKDLFAPGVCGRSDSTFNAGEGAFFVNKDGPVRAIRSYMGANSGPLTQRDHFFYERRHDVSTFLRVHAISGIVDFYDYSSSATGMSYYNDANVGGVTIDGNPLGDTVIPAPIQWEMVTGAQGTLIFSHTIDTDIPGFTYSSYYLDDASPTTNQCTGDGSAYGSSGLWVTGGIPNTDPIFVPPPFYTFITHRVSYAEGPNQTTALAQQRHDQTTQALEAAAVVPVGVAGDVPRVSGLAQNVPNPFTTSTRIDFAAPPNTRVTLRVYDVVGRHVATLAHDVIGMGFVNWDGRDVRGQRVAAGIYFYRLEAGDFTQTRKMILLR